MGNSINNSGPANINLSTISPLNHCKLGNFHDFFVICMLIFPKLTFSKNSFRNAIRVSNSLDPDQARHFVWPDLDSSCLQRLQADATSRLITSENYSHKTLRKSDISLL